MSLEVAYILIMVLSGVEAALLIGVVVCLIGVIRDLSRAERALRRKE